MAGANNWTWEENKAFEIKLAQVPDSPAKLQIIAEQIGKPVEEVKHQYEKLIHDIAVIESGGDVVSEYSPPRWTQQEHERFLEGLKQFGGTRAWEAISRDFVKTKTPKQVESHGDYYLKRQKEDEAKGQNVEAETKEEMKGSDLDESGVEKTDQD